MLLDLDRGVGEGLQSLVVYCAFFGDEILPSYVGIIINHDMIPINQPVFQWKGGPFFLLLIYIYSILKCQGHKFHRWASVGFLFQCWIFWMGFPTNTYLANG